MRLDKSFRVILNSPIFPKMTVERATDRSVRFGAQDESHLRIFVIKVHVILHINSISYLMFSRHRQMIVQIYAKNYNHVFKFLNDNNNRHP